jgi:hypothetical protein
MVVTGISGKSPLLDHPAPDPVFQCAKRFDEAVGFIEKLGLQSCPPDRSTQRDPSTRDARGRHPRRGGGLLPGPFVLQGPNIDDDDYTGDMTHRFYQAAQQQDCSMANATKDNPTGCLNDLFPFVMDTYARTSATSQGNFSVP